MKGVKSFFIIASVVATALAAPGSWRNKCKNPRVRKEWRSESLGYNGRKAFVDAIKCLSSLPHDPGLKPTGATPGLPPIRADSSRYDDFVYTHMDATDSAHYTGIFFGWHRLFLNTLENMLRKECHYTESLPFWDWTSKDYHDIEHSYIFNADPEVGFGAFPGPETNYTVTTGAFRNLIRAYPYTHHVQRNYSLTPWEEPRPPFTFRKPHLQANTTLTPKEWKRLVTGFTGNYSAFQYMVDGVRWQGMHSAAHLIIGGLGGDASNLSYSPNVLSTDVIFFLLHCQLDRLWAAWQAHSPHNRHAIGGGLTQDITNYDIYPTGRGTPVTLDTVVPLSNLGPDTKIKELMDTEGGVLCYKYEYY
ncbi:Di-copper centre-containing protein [Cantharellus anzutake]|uniref:Di-copper centre-containing protein n=1 Tax=Cantharellus anzutake TaxID=1750568 RepID=UPI00190718C7|nr:Di-copper centre-containing protein [Cantharellus anzutake]KAF8342253.1 Di-copper centre-containing protein [Cantharellus anzutake]